MKFEGREKTLFLGNGFTRSIFKNIPSWDQLPENQDIRIGNNTILYEMF